MTNSRTSRSAQPRVTPTDALGMPRLRRSDTHIPGALAHVIIRFVDGRYLLDDDGRRLYLAMLAAALSLVDWTLLSYALMSTHIHLGLLMGEAELREWAHSMHVRFSQQINRRLRSNNAKALGHVLGDRPSSKPVCPSRTRFVLGYHHRNPIEAGVTEDASKSDWTSHPAYLGIVPPVPGLDVELGLKLAGFEDSQRGRVELHRWVQRDQVDFGGVVAEETELVPVDARVLRSIQPEDVVRVAAELTGEPEAELCGACRRGPVVEARRIALVAGLGLGFSARAMADALWRTESAVSRLLSRRHDERRVRAGAERVRQLVRRQAEGVAREVA